MGQYMFGEDIRQTGAREVRPWRKFNPRNVPKPAEVRTYLYIDVAAHRVTGRRSYGQAGESSAELHQFLDHVEQLLSISDRWVETKQTKRKDLKETVFAE